MSIAIQSVWSDIQTIQTSAPLVHSITNYVVMESTANGLLAIGASPIMAHALDDMDAIITIANSLVLNIGTLSATWLHSMFAALKAANAKGIPVVIDPVGAGATAYRTEAVHSILRQGKATVIRGNASEIAALAGDQTHTKGVDSLLKPTDCRTQAQSLASNHRCVVWMSGPTDLITDGQTGLLIHNGDPLMSRVTGMGCLATALTGAFLAVNPDPLLACAHAAIVMGVAGEIAAQASKGPGSFKVAFLDTLYTLSLNQLEERVRVTTA